jgi:multisubunit Na+/H+ antiporter MnhG subunit
VSARDCVVYVLVSTAVAAELVCCLGMLAMRRAIDRLHYAGAATTIGPTAAAIAVVVNEGLVSTAGLNALVIAVFLLGAGPALTSATARTIRLRERGTLESSAAERRH